MARRSRNEAQIRYDLIDPALEKRGWQRVDICVEETAAKVDTIQGRGLRRPAGHMDYVLRRPLCRWRSWRRKGRDSR